LPQISPAGEAPAQFLSEFQVHAFQSAFGLATRRSQAMTDYLRSLASVRQPNDLVALQMSFWSQMLDDYSSAMSESLAPLAGAEVAAPATPPRSQAVA